MCKKACIFKIIRLQTRKRSSIGKAMGASIVVTIFNWGFRDVRGSGAGLVIWLAGSGKPHLPDLEMLSNVIKCCQKSYQMLSKELSNVIKCWQFLITLLSNVINWYRSDCRGLTRPDDIQIGISLHNYPRIPAPASLRLAGALNNWDSRQRVFVSFRTVYHEGILLYIMHINDQTSVFSQLWDLIHWDFMKKVKPNL